MLWGEAGRWREDAICVSRVSQADLVASFYATMALVRRNGGEGLAWVMAGGKSFGEGLVLLIIFSCFAYKDILNKLR